MHVNASSLASHATLPKYYYYMKFHTQVCNSNLTSFKFKFPLELCHVQESLLPVLNEV